MSTIGNINGTPGLDLTSTGQAKFKDNMFLNLLVAEMKTQNPLEPVDNSSFMEQMSQFSSMEQSREMNDSLLQLLQFQGLLARMQGLNQGSNLLGKVVEFDVGGGDRGSGEVVGIQVKDGEIHLELEDRTIPMSSVIGVKEKAADPGGQDKNDE